MYCLNAFLFSKWIIGQRRRLLIIVFYLYSVNFPKVFIYSQLQLLVTCIVLKMDEQEVCLVILSRKTVRE
jgi:hypothetical protein